MTSRAANAAIAPATPDTGSDGDLDVIRQQFEAEAVKAESAELYDAFSALAALLLDALAARKKQGEFPTPCRASCSSRSNKIGGRARSSR